MSLADALHNSFRKFRYESDDDDYRFSLSLMQASFRVRAAPTVAGAAIWHDNA
jgi:hypothetical protein